MSDNDQTVPKKVIRNMYPAPEYRFLNAKIGFTYEASTAGIPPPIMPPAGSPNVPLVLLDDAGFGRAETFGGLVPTPTLDRLADRGLRLSQFHMCLH